MAARSKPPFRADHVGSLLRPPHLIEAREKRSRGEITAGQLKELEDKEVRAAVKLQEDAGLQSITDGDYRRGHWWMDFVSAIEGAAVEGGMPIHFQSAGGQNAWVPPKTVVKSKLKHSRGISVDDFRFLRSATTRTPKQCVPSPSIMHFRGGRDAVDRSAYPEMGAFFTDVARVYNEEFRALKDVGCRYIQIDDVNFAFLCDSKMRDLTRKIGEDPDKLPHTYSQLINDTMKGLKPEIVFGVHLCRGNHMSNWVAQGGYEPVAEVMFNELDVDAFFLEYDSDRAGGFEPLRFVPKGKFVVLGLITSKFPQLENKDAVKRRIEEASKYVSLDQLCLSPQCGFASTIEGNKVTVDDEKRKLALVVDIAREVWGSA